MIKTLRAVAAAAIFSIGFIATAFAAGPDVNATNTGLALRGYDPVAYHTVGKPTVGDFSITAQHNGATYRFSSEENKAAFIADPAKYSPKYGGFCAFGLANGVKVDGDPNLWAVVDGKLYLNLAPPVQKRWDADRENFIKSADKNWENVKDVAPEDTL